jgi:hypothetical protein
MTPSPDSSPIWAKILASLAQGAGQGLQGGLAALNPRAAAFQQQQDAAKQAQDNWLQTMAMQQSAAEQQQANFEQQRRDMLAQRTFENDRQTAADQRQASLDQQNTQIQQAQLLAGGYDLTPNGSMPDVTVNGVGYTRKPTTFLFTPTENDKKLHPWMSAMGTSGIEIPLTQAPAFIERMETLDAKNPQSLASVVSQKYVE